MQKPSERYKLASDNNIIKFKKPVHDPFKKKSQHDLEIHPIFQMHDSGMCLFNFLAAINQNVNWIFWGKLQTSHW